MTRIAAILGGGDWTDASVDHLVLPEGMDVDTEREQWRTWVHDVHSMQIHDGRKPEYIVKYIGLCEWLISHGAREASDTEVEVHSDF